MKILTDDAQFHLVMREDDKVLDGKRMAGAVHDVATFPYQLFADNCPLFSFLLEKEALVGEKSFITDVYLLDNPYCTIYHQHVVADDGDYERFIVAYTFRLSKVFIVG